MRYFILLCFRRPVMQEMPNYEEEKEKEDGSARTKREKKDEIKYY